jgi:multiple sugar transport system permease protein
MRQLCRSEAYFIGLMLLPIILLIAFLAYYPAISTFATSLTSKSLRVATVKCVFFRNYLRLFLDSEFWVVTLRSLTIVLGALPLEILIGLFIALVLNERFLGRGIVRTLVVLPLMLPPVVNGFLWNWVLNGEYGALNGLLYQLGFIDQYHFWLKEPSAQILWAIVVQTWTRFGFPTIILLAGLQSIPEELFEAAQLDGANFLARLRYITLPALLPALTVAVVVEFISAFQIFDVVWTLTAGGSAGQVINPFTKTLMIYNYQLVFRDLKVGLGAALSYVILLMSMGVGLILIRFLYNRAIE